MTVSRQQPNGDPDDKPDGDRAATLSLSDVLSQAARSLQEQHGDVESTLRAITTAAVDSVPGAEQCGISYVTGRSKVEPRAATSDLPEKVDALQQQLQQGPCIDAVWQEEVVRVDDVGSDPRWPLFAQQAAALGVGSMLCFQLFVTGDQLGALNLYARDPGAFDAECEDVGRLFASHAAVALAGAEHEANLRAGMNNRTVIGQAQGILMERHRLTGARAFELLAGVSQQLNRKLVDIAQELVETGALPDTNRRRD